MFLVGDYFANCFMAADLATCVVNSTVSAPADPTCGDQPLTAEVTGDNRGRLIHECRSDANGGQDLLNAGESVQVGDLRCAAGEANLHCAHVSGSRHGFEVNSSSFRGF